MNLRFHPDAQTEFEQAILYYESQQVGLGARFIDSVESAIDSILSAPTMWPELEAPVRRRLTRVFPYAILYATFPDHILILAVMHCHQKPSYWASRLT
ncbi:MAG: type II toxin-antitoxin system RelE/ParE family toxin [Pseudomonadales bacterium]